MSKFTKSAVAAAFAASLLAAPAFAQSAASTGATDNAASQNENYKVRDEEGAMKGSSSMSSPAPAQSTGANSNAAAQEENYKVREGQNGSGSVTGGSGAPVQGTNTRN